MLRLLLVLCSFVAAFAGNNTTVIDPTPTTTLAVETTSLVPHNSTMSLSMSLSPYASMSSTFPNGTVAPTQMPHTASVTSAAPTPMTSSAMPPITKPTTAPPPLHYGHYDVKKDNKTCILAELDVTFHVKYLFTNTTTNSTKNETTNAVVHLPYPRTNASVRVTGGCLTNSSYLLVEWPIANKSKPLFIFEMKFKTYHPDKNNTKVTNWEVASISLTIYTKDNPKFRHAAEPTIHGSANSKDFKEKVQVAQGSSYQCQAPVTYNMSAVMADFSHVRLQPFDVKNDTFSGKYKSCKEDEPTKPTKKDENNIVPIAVGCALAGLVLIVLIAYIIGRRKSQRGYEKV